jgi:hypothetical protein
MYECLTRMQKVKGSSRRESPVAERVLESRPLRHHEFSGAITYSLPEMAELERTDRTKKTCKSQVFSKRLMGLEPTTFCMAIVCEFRINACFCGFRLNPITGDYRGFAGYWSPNGPPGYAWELPLSSQAEAMVSNVPRLRERPRPPHRLTCATPREAAAGYSSQPKLIAHRSRARGAWRRAPAPCPVSVRPFVVSATIHSPP